MKTEKKVVRGRPNKHMSDTEEELCPSTEFIEKYMIRLEPNMLRGTQAAAQRVHLP